MQAKLLAFCIAFTMMLEIAQCRIIPTVETKPDRHPTEVQHHHRRHRLHRQAHLAADELVTEDVTEVVPKYNHNCFFTPVNCQHRSQLKAVKVDSEEMQRTVAAKKDCKDCKLRPALGFLRRRKYFFTA